MEIRIGVAQSPRELEIELPPGTNADEIVATVEAALADESGVLWLEDRSGRRIGVPSARVAYVEIGKAGGRTIGFAG